LKEPTNRSHPVWGRGGERERTADRTHCNTLQHTAERCNTLHRTATHCKKLQHTATDCNRHSLQNRHTATHCNRKRKRDLLWLQIVHRSQITLQRTATHCNTLQHAATRCNTQGGRESETWCSCRSCTAIRRPSAAPVSHFTHARINHVTHVRISHVTHARISHVTHA